MHFSRVVIILFSAGLSESAFFNYSYVKLGFRLFVLWFFSVSVTFVIRFSVEFYVI